MDEFFASRPATNDSFLCIGPLTRADAAEATDEGIGNGLGYYIFVAEASRTRAPVEILGRLAGEHEARRLCELLGLQAAHRAAA